MTHKRNRRFKRNVILNKRMEKRKRYRARKKENKQQVKQNAPYQNAINLSNTVLSEEQKSILVKGPSFLRIPSDINWYEVRKYFTKFIKKGRQHLEARQQQQQLQINPQVNTKDLCINKDSFPLHKPS